MPYLETVRLTVFPFGLDLLYAALEGPAIVEEMVHMNVPADWPGPDIVAALPSFIQQREQAPDQADWSVHLVARKADRTLIGFTGPNNGPPDGAGTVEIGYDILPAYQGRGYAVEATGAIVFWLWTQPSVRRIVADCAVDNAASIGVLERLAFIPQAPADGRLNWALTRED